MTNGKYSYHLDRSIYYDWVLSWLMAINANYLTFEQYKNTKKKRKNKICELISYFCVCLCVFILNFHLIYWHFVSRSSSISVSINRNKWPIDLKKKKKKEQSLLQRHQMRGGKPVKHNFDMNLKIYCLPAICSNGKHSK